MTNKKNESHHTGAKVAVGVGVGLAAVAAAGAYFFGSKEGAKRREKVLGWADKLKGEILDKLKELQDVNEEVYHGIVDHVVAAYHGVKNIDTEELSKLGKELKSHWENIRKDIETGMSPKSKRSPRKKE